MSDLRYVCMSDVHFGAANSLLTHVDADACTVEPNQPSHVLSRLVDCLRALVGAMAGEQKPMLILHGDVLDLALSTIRHAAMAFERFVELAWPENGESLFEDRVLYIPGNHDHHEWESASGIQYGQAVAATPPGAEFPRFRYSTPMFRREPLSSRLVAELLHRGSGGRANATTIYPNLGLVTADHGRCVVVSHGQYIESIYLLQSRFLNLVFPDHVMPTDADGIERENGAWIDYFWSAMGNAGKFGEGVALIYDKLQDPAQTRALFKTVATSLAAIRREAAWEHWVDARAIDAAVDVVCGRLAGLARNQTDDVLGADAREGLKWFLEGPVANSLYEELGARRPADMTFVFGHTHKPFEGADTFAGYDAPVKLFNSGGWVVDTPRPNPIEGGALILIDDELSVASLRMYNEAADPKQYAVRIEDAGSAAGRPGPFCQALRTKIDATADPWAIFSMTAAVGVGYRAQQLQTLMARRSV